MGDSVIPDPLGIERVLPFRIRVHPLGFPLEVATNADSLVELLRARYGYFNMRRDAPLARLDLVVTPSPDPPAGGYHVSGSGHLVTLVADSENFAVCDLAQRYAYVHVSETTKRHSYRFEDPFLDVPVYSMLVSREVTAIHAAAVALEGRGLLFCAPSGTGKSSLAYACAKQDWTFLCDDASYLLDQDGAQVRLLGKPGSLKLKRSAEGLFPELQNAPVELDRHGEPHFTLNPLASGMLTAEELDSIEAVVFLNRQQGVQARLSPVGSTDAFSRIAADIPSYGPQIRDRHHQCVRRLLAAAPPIELIYSSLSDAIEKLTELVSKPQPTPGGLHP